MDTKKIKSLFYIAAIVVMTILIAVSCKKKSTQASAFQIVDEPISTNETPEPVQTNEDINKPVLPIDNKANMDQFNGLYFESKAYELNNNFKFTAKVGIGDSGYQKGVAYIQFEDGCKFYQGFQVGDYNGIYNLLYSGSRNGLDYVKAKARFTEEGYLYVKFENYSWEIEYALAEEGADSNPSEVLKPDKTITINKNAGPKQYAGNYFESITYKNDDGSEFKYTIEIKNHSDGRSTVLIFSGYENGKQFSKQYNFPGFIAGRGDNFYNYNEGGSGMLNNGISASDTVKVRFYNDTNGTWADLKPANYNFTIKLALKNK